MLQSQSLLSARLATIESQPDVCSKWVGCVTYLTRCIPRIPGEQLKFALAASVAISLVLGGCAENPITAPSSNPLLSHDAISFTKSAPPPKGGIAAQVATTSLLIDSLGILFGVEPQPATNKNGIPQLISLQAAQISLIETSISAEVARVNAAITAGTATGDEINALIEKLWQARYDMYRLNGLFMIEKAVTIGDMFTMQTLMNHLSQMSETSTSVVDALNQTLADMARNVKGD
jgi:hypothetical protein